MSGVSVSANGESDVVGEQIVAGMSDEARSHVQRADAELLARCFAEAQGAWPDVELAPAEFGAALAPAVAEASDVAGALAATRANELYLARAAASSAPAREALIARFGGVVLDALVRLGVSPEAQDTVTAATVESLARYTGRESLPAWLRAATAFAASTARAAEGAGSAMEHTTTLVPDDSDDAPEEVKSAVDAAFTSAAVALPVRVRNVLRFHLSDGLGLDAIGAIYGASRADVAAWLSAGRAQLVDEAIAHVKERTEGEVLAAALALIEARLERTVEQRLSTVREERATDPERPSVIGPPIEE